MKKYEIKFKRLDTGIMCECYTYEKSFKKAYEMAKTFVHHQKIVYGVKVEIISVIFLYNIENNKK
jgi:hypothetical protein